MTTYLKDNLGNTLYYNPAMSPWPAMMSTAGYYLYGAGTATCQYSFGRPYKCECANLLRSE